MQLFRRNSFILALVIPLACDGGSTSPPPPDATYILLTVGGKTPPVVTNAQPGDTITLLGSSIQLFEPATFSLVQRIRFAHTGNPATTTTYTTNYSYRIIGDSIALDPPP